MKSGNHLKDIILALRKNGVDFIICGGVALVLHGIERMTMDLDLSLEMKEDNLKRFLDVMDELGLVPRAPVPAESILDPEKRKMMVDQKKAVVFTFLDPRNPYRQVDIFITDAFSFESMRDHVETVKIGGEDINLLSKKKLLDMKKSIPSPRDKDRFDIVLLEKILAKSRDD